MCSDFSAKEPALGYFYQVRYGLYLLLRSREVEGTKILIEALDDIEIRTDKELTLVQTKYHKKVETNLTDRSSDFWKTIRVWSEQIKDKKINIDEAFFCLVTTENISNRSILLDIKNKNNIENIQKSLKEIAKEKDNKTNKKGYITFNNLNAKEQKTLIERMHIIDASLDFNAIDISIKNELKLSALPNQITPLLERLEGWFFRDCILHLQGKKEYISFDELQLKILYITDSFKYDNLPIDFPRKITPTDEELDSISAMNFYKQLNLIGLSPRLCSTAISNYYRAFNQRSKWLKDDLLNPQEEINYDQRLVDDWEQRFDLVLDNTDDFGDDEKKEYGEKFYKSYLLENTPNIYIRERFQEAYVTLGSFQMLSDKLKVGWHPSFEDLINKDEE